MTEGAQSGRAGFDEAGFDEAGFDEALLDEPDRLAAADTAGLLRSAAGAGAQVRSTAEAAEEVGLLAWAGERPRALVLLACPGTAPGGAGLLAALLGPECPMPVVLTDTVPGWIGALDVVLAHTDDPGQWELADAVDRAVRRGARVLLTAPPDGPVAAAAAGRAVLLTPRTAVPPALGLPRVLTAGLLAAAALGLLAANLHEFTDVLADELDREAERSSPVHEPSVNPAKSLALRLAERTPLLWGTDRVATAVAEHAAAALATHAGVVAHAASYPDAAAMTALHRAAIRASGVADVFRDPFADPEVGSGPPRTVLLAVLADAAATAVRAAAVERLPGADLLTPAEELSAPAAPGADARSAALLALRFDLAALYLGFAAGTIGGSGSGGAGIATVAG